MCYIPVQSIFSIRLLSTMVVGALIFAHSSLSEVFCSSTSRSPHQLRGFVVVRNSHIDTDGGRSFHPASADLTYSNNPNLRVATSLKGEILTSLAEQGSHDVKNVKAMSSAEDRESGGRVLQTEPDRSVGNTIMNFMIMVFNIIAGFFSGLFG